MSNVIGMEWEIPVVLADFHKCLSKNTLEQFIKFKKTGRDSLLLSCLVLFILYLQ